MFVARRVAGCAAALAAIRRNRRTRFTISALAGRLALHDSLLRGAGEDDGERGEDQRADDHPARSLVKEGNQALNAFGVMNDVTPVQDRVEDAGQRSARDETGAEERAGPDLRL